jgi:PAS domain S-box-containing protein
MTGTHGDPSPLATATITVDRCFRVRGWSDAATAMFGWSAPEASGAELFALLGDAARAALDAATGWCSCRCRGEHRRRDGNALVLAVRFEPLIGPDADIGVLLFERDEHEHARDAETRLRDALVVRAMQEGVIVFASDGRATSCNPAATRILGLDEDQLLGRTTTDPRWRIVHEDGSPWPAERYPVTVTLRTGVGQSGVVVGVHKPDGSLAWVKVNCEPIRLRPGAPHHAVVATFVDVTDARAAQERVKRLAGLLPVCAWCKSVRNDRGYWQQIEHYLAEHTDARFTHGLCPACSERLPQA